MIVFRTNEGELEGGGLTPLVKPAHLVAEGSWAFSAK